MVDAYTSSEAQVISGTIIGNCQGLVSLPHNQCLIHDHSCDHLNLIYINRTLLSIYTVHVCVVY